MSYVLSETGISIKNGEGKWFTFNVTRGGAAINLATAILKFAVKQNIEDTTYKIEKLNATFDKTQASVGIVKVNLSATDTAVASLPSGLYYAELEIVITAGTDVDKSLIFPLTVEQAVTHD